MQRPNSNSLSRGLRSCWYCNHRIVRRLLGEAVLQLEREHRQPVDEQPDVQRPLRIVPAVAKLPGNREPVLREPLLRLDVVLRWRTVEQIQVQRSVFDPVAEHVDGAALGNLPLQPSHETRAASDRPPTASASRRPPAAYPSETSRAGPSPRNTPGRSRGSCRRSTPPRRNPAGGSATAPSAGGIARVSRQRRADQPFQSRAPWCPSPYYFARVGTSITSAAPTSRDRFADFPCPNANLAPSLRKAERPMPIRLPARLCWYGKTLIRRHENLIPLSFRTSSSSPVVTYRDQALLGQRILHRMRRDFAPATEPAVP